MLVEKFMWFRLLRSTPNSSIPILLYKISYTYRTIEPLQPPYYSRMLLVYTSISVTEKKRHIKLVVFTADTYWY